MKKRNVLPPGPRIERPKIESVEKFSVDGLFYDSAEDAEFAADVAVLVERLRKVSAFFAVDGNGDLRDVCIWILGNFDPKDPALISSDPL